MRFGPLFDPHVRGRAGNYVAQTMLATLAMMAIMLLEDVVLRAAIVVAMASTVFTIFVVPNSVAATPRKVIGGHLVGVAAGSLIAAVIALPAIAPMVEDSAFAVRFAGGTHGGTESRGDGGDGRRAPTRGLGRPWPGRTRVGPGVCGRHPDKGHRPVDHKNGSATQAGESAMTQSRTRKE